MPGDPLRAEHIANKFLTKPRRVTDVRNMYGYTGEFRGKRVSVMAHGMGIPSCSIYATELIKEYGVKTLIRVGSCGALADDVKLGDVIIALGGSTDSKVNRIRFMDHDFAAIADFDLVAASVKAAATHGTRVRVGNVFSSDLFYTPQEGIFDKLEAMGVLAVEMEIAGLYGLAAEFASKYHCRALGILTVSDHIRRHESLSAEQRRSGFDAMAEIALETAIAV